MTSHALRRLAVALFALLSVAFFTGQAWAYPGGAGLYPSSGIGSCTGCHYGTNPPSTVDLNSTALSGGPTFNVAPDSTTIFALTWTSLAGHGGFRVTHANATVADSNNAYGTLHAGTNAHECSAGGDTCNGVTQGNNEVTHASQVAASGGKVTFGFSYVAPSNACNATYDFTLWINDTNGDGACYDTSDSPKSFTFHIHVTSSCNDGNGCTTDSCNSGTCAYTPVVCTASDQCHNAGTCSGGVCSNPAKTNGTGCNDGNSCTLGDSCQSGTCTGTPIVCTASDQCHDVGTCSGGVCSNPAKTNGTGCNDGDPCTTSDQCTGGACAGTAIVCTALDQCHTAGTCSGGVCSNPLKPDSTPCNDGDACTQTDTCQTGTCTGSNPVTCSALDECHTAGTCNPATGTCSNPNKTDGTACTADSLPCTLDECLSGTCSHPAGNAGTVCSTALCLDATNLQQQSTCNGVNTTCPAPGTLNCSPNLCSSGACTGGCASDADCASDSYCASNGQCTKQVAQGGACNLTNDCKQGGCHECQTGNCVDGVCCNTACGGGVGNDCQACNVGGSVGTCSSLTGTTCDDGNACTQTDTCQAGACTGANPVVCTALNECHTAGTCNPATGTCSNPTKADNTACTDDGNPCTTDTCQSGTCSHPAGNAGTQCRASNGPCDVAENCDGTSAACPTDSFKSSSTQCRGASCAAGVGTLAANCTGSTAACPAVQTQTCDPYICNGTACGTTCGADTDCILGDFCNGGTCASKRANGQTCGADNFCTSGVCADGVCCNTACSGQCQACDVAGKLGTCSAVAGAPHGTRTACLSDGSSCAGQCDGVNTSACAYPGGATQCRAASCTGGVATLSASCGGTGACPAVQTQTCSPFVCGATQCIGNCTNDVNCIAGYYCSGGVCTAKLGDSSTCASDSQCQSDHCIDGVCCDTACNGQCEACNVSGSEGTCSAVKGAPAGARPACSGNGTTCGGTCDGTLRTACSYPGAGTQCRAASCASAVATLATDCNGAGACPPAQQQDCAPNQCSGTICAGNCSVDTDCSVGEFCSAGVCVSTHPNGSPCAGSSQCTSSLCVDGVCCDQACSGQCQACDVAGSLGTCTSVVGAPHGTRAVCASDGSACGGACDGTNAAACSYPGASTQCRTASCANDVATLAASCDGSGACPPAQSQSCVPFTCGATQCNGNCTVDTDCASGQFCAGGVCTATLTNGTACSADSQCTSAQCVDGVCCDQACSGQCQACDNAGNVGTCTNVTGAPHGGRGACAGVGACAGSCDGTDGAACTFPGGGTTCGTAACAGPAVNAAPTCNGAGTCLPPIQTLCSPYVCDPATTQCATTCTTNADCASGFECNAGSCTLIVPDAGTDAAADAGSDAAMDAGADADAGSDATADASADATTDAAPDATPDTGVDASPDATADASGDGQGGNTGDAASADSSNGNINAIDTGTCGCRVPGRPAPSNAPFTGLGLLLGLGVMLRRRRSRRAHRDATGSAGR